MLRQGQIYTVYILSGRDYGPIFIDAASNLRDRLRQHKSGKTPDRFRIDRLVYVERYSCGFKAKARASALKQASREWLDHLIASGNPAWRDLSGAPSEKLDAA